jgi:hypothetical protein
MQLVAHLSHAMCQVIPRMESQNRQSQEERARRHHMSPKRELGELAFGLVRSRHEARTNPLYVRYVADWRLTQLKLSNFFEQRATECSKGGSSGSWDGDGVWRILRAQQTAAKTSPPT